MAGMHGAILGDTVRGIVESETDTWNAEMDARESLATVQAELSATLLELEGHDRERAEIEAAAVQMFPRHGSAPTLPYGAPSLPVHGRCAPRRRPTVDPGGSSPAGFLPWAETAAQALPRGESA
ncbi:hypothetical protein E1265_21395 [Streptomyces sp. 8K308]|uniref:hypothetical protein n=1 Tax=Streptomyces sp. 8K308 TaxID=2530388 RepID=UPI00105338D0|nr:hypothetical protein [Streptomyces sp. 8K308]TDC20628.1 hypothetical protein E1265_21395 [Streptomyces sp. 8K308]